MQQIAASTRTVGGFQSLPGPGMWHVVRSLGSRPRRKRRMAVLMIMEVDGVTTDDYDQLNEAIGVRVDEDGRFVVVDLWESEEKLGAFFERLGPAMEKVGMPQTEPKIMQAHNHSRGTGQEA